MAGQDTLSAARCEAIQSSFSKQGFLVRIDAAIIDLRSGYCAIEIPFGDHVAQQHGFFHGGAIGALADTAGGYAAMTMVADDSEVLTLEYKINFLRPASGRLLIAEATVLRTGRTVVITRADVFAVSGTSRTLCAAVQQSIMPMTARRDGI